MSAVVEPLAVVAVTILVNEPAMAVDLITSPDSDEFAAILPYLSALALTLPGARVPLAHVDGIVVEAAGTLGYKVV